MRGDRHRARRKDGGQFRAQEPIPVGARASASSMKGANLVDDLPVRCETSFASRNPMQRLQIQCSRGLWSPRLHRRALHGFGNRVGIIEVRFFCVAIRADIFGPASPGIVPKRCEFAAQVMVHRRRLPCADQARRYIGEPRYPLATRPFCRRHDGAARIVATTWNGFLPISMADHGDRGLGV